MLARNRKFSVWVTLIMILSLVLAACGGGGGGGTTGGGGTATTGGQTGASTAPSSAPTTGTGTGASSSPTVATGGATGSTTPAAQQTGTAGGSATGTAGPGAGMATGTAAAPMQTAAVPPCPDAAKGQTVEMWSPLTGSDGKFMTKLAEQFSNDKTANPQGITVRHVANGDYLKALTTAAAANKLPTMTVIRFDDIPAMAERQVLKPLTPELFSIIGPQDLQQDFPAMLWSAGEYKGQRYTIPLDTHPLVMYYNKDMFKAAGIPDPGQQPMSKQDFEAAVEKLNTGGKMGWAIGTLFSSGTLFTTILRQNGGSLVNQDGTKATYNSQQGVEALSYIRDMKQKYSPSLSGTGDPEFIAFQQGKAAIVFHGPWHISDAEQLKFAGFAPIPQFGSKYAVWGGSHQLAITTTDPAKQAAAACWMGWLSANSVQWAKAGQVPARSSQRMSPELQSIAPPIYAVRNEADAIALTPPVPLIGPAISTPLDAAIAAVVQGQNKDVKGALDQAAAKTDQLLQQNAQSR